MRVLPMVHGASSFAPNTLFSKFLGMSRTALLCEDTIVRGNDMRR